MDAMPPQQLPNTQAAYASQDAEFDSVFVDYKQKGHAIELVGKETLNGAPVYHLKVTKKGGPPQDYYLDAETGLEKKISVAGRSPGRVANGQRDGVFRLPKRGWLAGAFRA